MIITHSTVQLTATRAHQESHEQQESLTVWQREAPIRQLNLSIDPEQARNLAAEMHGEIEPPKLSLYAPSFNQEMVLLEIDQEALMDAVSEFEISLLKLIVEAMTGKKINLIHPSALTSTEPQEAIDMHEHASNGSSGNPGFGMVYEYRESHYESEQTTFTATAVVLTEDGSQIDIHLELNMSREFSSSNSLQIRAGEALKDPLVVNFNGTAAELTQRKFSFDIDADGHTDQISFVTPDSGFLVLDRNDDGTVNDGKELFGALSGNGFEELSTYDNDDNGWIDAGDPIYDRLRIWSKDAEGNDHLIALGRLGIGAIYLGHIDTPFLLKGANNETLGQTRATGIYLGDESQTGTIQQLDLVV